MILEINFKKYYYLNHTIWNKFLSFYSRGNEPVPPREWARGVKGDGTSAEEEVVRTFCRNC